MSRYENIGFRTFEGKKMYKTTIYPQITPKASDIYVETGIGDRLDNLAYEYYGDSTLWWIISESNNMKKDTLVPTPGSQLRIPTEITDFLNRFDELNQNR